MQVNEASDVYSVGALLAILNDQVDFEAYGRSESGAAFLQHCTKCNTAPAWLQRLLISTRLDKPSERPTAADVLHVIMTCGSRPSPSETAEILQHNEEIMRKDAELKWSLGIDKSAPALRTEQAQRVIEITEKAVGVEKPGWAGNTEFALLAVCLL